MCQNSKLIAYEQSVKAYQFQVTRYNTWMNYYALFVGALFVAFYNVPTAGSDIQCLPIIISLLGIVASICWMASLIGNCAWMNNYIQTVKENERIFFEEPVQQNDENLTNPDLSVYRHIHQGEQIPKVYYKEFISTQKMTQWFVGAVLAVWIYIFIYLCTGDGSIAITCNCELVNSGTPILISIVAAWGIWILLKHTRCGLYSDDLSDMNVKKPYSNQ